jgi:hypothetical protein
VPKLAAERRRRNAPTGPDLITVPTAVSATPEPADPTWHPVILTWFDGLREGPEAEFLTPAGWGFARYLAERESRNLQLARPSAQTSALFVASQADLLTTEGSRRRLRVELDRRHVIDGDDVIGKWRALRGGLA